MPLDPKVLKKLVERRHPRYDGLLEHWSFLESSYEGGRDWFKDNIFHYHKEGPVEYQERVARAYRFNHTREVVDLINKYLFRSNIVRNETDAPEELKTFWRQTNAAGMDIEEFMRVVSASASVLGRPWVIVDNANRDVGADASKIDETPASIHVYVVRPQDVLDMSWGEDGMLNWILVREWYRDDADPFDDAPDVSERFRLWTRNDWYLIEPAATGRDRNNRKKSYRLADSGSHELGEVPAVQADNAMSPDPWYAPALIADIAYLDRACANYASNLDAIIQDQTFSQLAMPAQNVLPGEEAYNKLLEMGTKRVFLYDGEGGVGPHFLSPDPRQADLIIGAIRMLINEIYHSVGLAGEHTKADNAQGIDNSSGVAKTKDFERVVALLASKSDALETVENKIARLVCKWAGREVPEQDLVAYPRQFDVRGLWDEFDIALKLSVIEAPASIRSHQMLDVVTKLFPNLGRDLRQKMENDIEQWATTLQETADVSREALQAQKSALIGEAQRNRAASGQTQSATKGRETGRNDDRETGQE